MYQFIKNRKEELVRSREGTGIGGEHISIISYILKMIGRLY